MSDLSPLEKANLVVAARRAAGIPLIRLDPIAKAHLNPKSLRFAINGKCWDCVGAGADPHPRATIRACRITDCTLWPVRPYQSAAEEAPSDE